MSAVSDRVYQELQSLKAAHGRLCMENLRLRSENGRLVHECRISYLEGLDQGRAEAEALEAC